MAENPKVNLALVNNLPDGDLVQGTVYMSPDVSGNFIKVAVTDSSTVTIFDGSVYTTALNNLNNRIDNIDVELLTNITYSELKALRDTSALVPGMQYRITDYECTTSAENTSVGGHAFDIIVTADSSSKLNENARAARNSSYTDYAPDAKPEAWELKYCLDNDTTRFAWADSTNGKGVIFYMKDEHNNSAGYDFKSIQFLRYALKLADATADYTPTDTGLVYDASTQPNRYGSPYKIFTALQSYKQTGTYVNPFPMKYKGQDVNNYDFSVGYNILGTIQFPEADGTYLSTFNADWYYTFDYYKDGEHYDISSVGFEGINTRCLNNTLLPDFDALASVLDGSSQVKGLGATCFMNNYIADSENHNGYCFDNLIDIHSPFNTFGCFAVHNVFGNYCNDLIFGDSCDSNTFGNGCYSNTVGNYCYSNTFGDSCDYNTVGNSCYSNTFGNGCYYNTFGNHCYSNTVGNNCNSNTFGDNCSSNTFGDDCDSNTFGDSCDYNTVGNDCDSNTFGDNCDYNTVGNSCYSNTFGTLDTNNILVGSICNLTADNGVNQITVPTAEANGNYLYELVNYAPQTSYSSGSGCATLITKTGYNTSTAKSTVDSGTTWA